MSARKMNPVQEALMEQWAIELDSRRAREARVRKAALDNPDLSIALLAERFGEDEGYIRRVLDDAGIHRERDGFSLMHRRGDGHGKKRRRG